MRAVSDMKSRLVYGINIEGMTQEEFRTMAIQKERTRKMRATFVVFEGKKMTYKSPLSEFENFMDAIKQDGATIDDMMEFRQYYLKTKERIEKEVAAWGC